MKGINLVDAGGACFDGVTRVPIAEVGYGQFSVVPFSEDEDACYKFRLDLILHNATGEKQRVTIVLDWGDEVYQQYRNEVFLSHGGGPWVCAEATLDGASTVMEYDFPPGQTYITLNPKYDGHDLEAFLGKKDRCKDIHRFSLGKTKGGREIHALSLGSEGAARACRVLVTARTHPYETAGSFLLEGMVERCIEIMPHRRQQELEVFFVPMACPDGVAQGCCKLSEIGGVDLARGVGDSHHLWRIYTGFLASIRPILFIELHNWMLRDRDGLFYLNAWSSRRWRKRLGKAIPRALRRPLEMGLRKSLFRIRPGGLKLFAEENLGTRVMTMEFGWHRRSVENMKEIGRVIMDCVLSETVDRRAIYNGGRRRDV